MGTFHWYFISLCVFTRCFALVPEGARKMDSSYCYKKGAGGGVNQMNKIVVGWTCEQSSGKCLRNLAANVSQNECLYSLNVCKLICDRFGSLWPLPTKNLVIADDLVAVHSGKISFKLDIPRRSNQLWNMLEELQQYFLQAILRPSSKVENAGSELSIVLKVKNEKDLAFTYDTAEKYNLSVFVESKNTERRVVAVIEGDNYFGVRHGIETLSQLVVYDDFSNQVLIPAQVEISDEPAFKHRGILLDTSRSFYSVKSIKKTLDAMAQNKLNTFHWHITDSHSFPFESKTYPQMSAIGAYSPSQVYSWSDVKEIVKYGKIRGIRVIPELDAPSHVGEGWQLFDSTPPPRQTKNNVSASVSNVLLCFKAEPWRQYCVEPPCGLLNPLDPRVYQILGDLYAEFNTLFESDVFHMGGDEVSPYCWRNTPSIVETMPKRASNTNEPQQQHDQAKSDHENASNDDFFIELWSHFQNRAVEQFDKTAKIKNTRIILWTSSLTETSNVTRYLDKDRYIIQIWTTIGDKQIGHLLSNGYDLILSNYDALYFDCGFGAWIGEGNNWCSPYIGWQKVYMNDPTNVLRYANLSSNYGRQILGAEATLWSEQSDDSTLDNRLWPRASALAERLWTNPTSDWRSAEARILTQRQRMLNRGIAADLIEPLWCHQNEALCY
ncbi:chitooligosaccharidolytic beta-N-acetylglucosaminidase [Planococcus citri]|uniref:chitooligosaccharidolytic beta-N-acetylglucosaminidase n=1 Tax=Planococcus citri TaxID=170843 RepID=UPI0031F83281